ncbi:hypothetical protein Daura_23575 [Dactylosporangium aurantiacum]|uniref:Uncharacterized protein n=1 Tax=Dactylosporangium aurantiacum TaxID=35754 RepID=A0A9Q9IS98_9ACTN|nr:hypothetical protein [Dactylosporangium aurantiacum]MDG6103930.1 hypothetical protein [Dactylosporangium aurantiacum]UWZ58882.1 hypothetical protein Daura_23575 [Dactylosporangium aurantiacum]
MSSGPVDGAAGCPSAGPASTTSTAASPRAASYLGADADDAANAVDIGAGCHIVVGGRFSGVPGPVTTLAGGGPGTVVRLDPTGRTVVGVTRVPAVVADLEVRRTTGDIAVATGRGVLVLDAAAATVRWQAPGPASRVAIGDAGTVAALGGTTVRVFDAAGVVQSTIRLDGRTVNDVAVDDRDDLVVVTGFAQRGGPCHQVQIAYVHAYSRRGALRWKAYDFAADGLGDACADSRGDRVAVGRDGRLYFAGETAGGNTVFARDSRDIGRAAPNVAGDKFTSASNTGSAHLTYFARIDVTDGRVTGGSMLLARIDTKGDKGNTITPNAITADAGGNVYLGGVSAYRIADRDRLTMNGKTLAPYAGGDAWVLVTGPDLKKRLLWTVWCDGGKGEVRGVAASGGVAAVAARVDQAPFYTVRPVQPGAAPGTGAGYFATWPAAAS